MKLKKDLFHSLSSTINAFYIILIVLFTLLTGSIIYYVANWYPPAKITTSDIVITSQWHKTYHLVTLKLPLGKIDD